MKYDDASWHYGGDFPKDLPNEAGATHIGMFVAWTLLTGLTGSILLEELPEDLQRLRNRQITPGRFVMDACDEKFTDEVLDERGNAFAWYYYEQGGYMQDYEATFGGNVSTFYHVADTWENFDRLKPVLDRGFSQWSRKRWAAEAAEIFCAHADRGRGCVRIKHDGFRLTARRDAVGCAALYSWRPRFHQALSLGRGGNRDAVGTLLPDRRRGHRQRRSSTRRAIRN